MVKAIEEFASTTTIHGVQTFLMTKNRWFKVIWGLLMIASILAMIVQLYQTSKEFSRAPVTSSISLEAPDQWPTIMICPENWFDPSKAFDAGFNSSDVRIITKALELFPDIEDEGFLDVVAYLTERKVALNQMMAMMNLTTIEDMMELVTGDVVEAQAIGGGFLQLVKTIIYPPSPPRVCFYSLNVPSHYKQLNFDVKVGGGFYTVIRNPFNPKEKYEFKPGFYSVMITMGGISLLPKPSNPCVLGVDEMVCKETCEMENNKCDMSPWNVPHMYVLKERFDSLEGFNYDTFTGPNYTELREKWEKCPIEKDKCLEGCHSCHKWDIQVKIQEQFERSGEQFTTFHFEMNEDVKMIRESWAYTETMLVSNVGGLVSWYLGASILSVAHLGFFCLSLCFDKKPQEVMAAEEGRMSPVKERKKGRWTKLKRAFSRKKSVRRPASVPWVLHVSNFNKDFVTQT